jgi:hypothetical protein
LLLGEIRIVALPPMIEAAGDEGVHTSGELVSTENVGSPSDCSVGLHEGVPGGLADI